jgi:receptor protein-tyrosine kinase/non-specific protein-tyrosine kinase
LDLRRPTVRRLFQILPGLGLTDVIQGNAELAEVMHEVPIPSRSVAGDRTTEADAGPGSLRILASGTPPHDPGEIVASPAIATLIGQMQEEADIVLVDAPPVLQVGDALALSAHIDALFVCVRPQTVTRSMLDELRRVVAGAPAELIGAVVIGTVPKDMDSYGGYGYGYGYTSDTPVPPASEPKTVGEFALHGDVASRD